MLRASPPFVDTVGIGQVVVPLGFQVDVGARGLVQVFGSYANVPFRPRPMV